MTMQTTAPRSAQTLHAGDLVSEKEAAAILGLTLSCLRNWRWKGEGPRFRKIGRSVRYHRADIAAFAEGGEQ